jgi:hypothetical protein
MSEHVMNYIESDAPQGVTLVEWRRARFTASRRRLGLRTFVPGWRQPRLAI